MPIVTARLKAKGKHYEVSVDLDEALKIKDNAPDADITKALESSAIFHDLKKGERPSDSDLKDAFKTTEVNEIAKQIIQKGEVQKTQEFRDEEKQTKIKQVVELILQNASDQNGKPYTEDRIRGAIDQIHHNFTDKPAEQQMQEVLPKLKTVIPIKIEVKRIKLTIPAQYTGQVYGLIKDYKESEEWLPNGDLSVVLNIPAGMQIDFYEKLNGITHGTALSEELAQETE